MEKPKKQQYFIAGRSYSPDTATPLCSYTGIFETVTLYQSPQGAFFTVEESIIDGEAEKVATLSKAAARDFLDEHAAAIIAENYKKIFGNPKQG